jgi:hypothetical protein
MKNAYCIDSYFFGSKGSPPIPLFPQTFVGSECIPTK